MKTLRNKVNEEFQAAMNDVVHVLSEMKEKMKMLIKDGEFEPMEMMEVMGGPIKLIQNQAEHQTNISKFFDDAEERLSGNKKKKWGK